MKRQPYYSQFDGESIGNKRYGLGDEIDSDTNPEILTILADQGRISTSKPTTLTVPLVGTDKPVEDMSRAELEGSALSIMSTRILSMPSDDLRDAIDRHRAEAERKAGEDAGEPGTKDPADDSMTNGTGTPETPPAKPLGQMTTAELNATAEAEEITFGEDVKTNPDRVKAIQTARDAKAKAADTSAA